MIILLKIGEVSHEVRNFWSSIVEANGSYTCAHRLDVVNKFVTSDDGFKL